MEKLYNLDIHIHKDNVYEVIDDLRTIANNIERGIYVSMYEPVYSMSYPGEECADTSECTECTSLICDTCVGV